MLPHERALVERLKDEPFALIGINSDGNAEQVRKILEEQDIAWRNAIDDSTAGPLATRWNVNGWPTIYIIDGNGVIRHRDLRNQEMEDAVLELLAEMEQG